jgi:hypothetical protein
MTTHTNNSDKGVKEMNEMQCIDEGCGTNCRGEVYLQNWTPMCDAHADERQEHTRAALKALTVREDYHF